MRAAILTPFAFGWLALAAGLAMAQEVAPPPAVVSAFDACTKDNNASERSALLENTGWRVAPDDAERTALAALIGAERFSFTEPGTQSYETFITSYSASISAGEIDPRGGRDAGLPSGEILSIDALLPVIAEKKVVSVEMSSADDGTHLSVSLGRLDDGLMTMQCKLILASSVDDISRTALATSLGFDESHIFVQPSQGGNSGMVYAFRNETPVDPLMVRFRAFAPDGTLAQMANDLSLPVRIGSIIETTARPFPAD